MISGNMTTQRDSVASQGLKILIVGWPDESRTSPGSVLESSGHIVSAVPNISIAMRELLEKEFDILISHACCQEACELMRMARSIRPGCKRVVTTMWGQLLGDFAQLCDVDYVLPDSLTATELIDMLDVNTNRSEDLLVL